MTAPVAETIAAVATPPGRGGIGVIRVSGPRAVAVAECLLGECPPPRHARLSVFSDALGEPIDQGIALYFPGPNSFTGEDVLELQGHGGPVVLDMLLEAVLAQDARLARPGEFSEQAFLNGRMDLAQAEAVADLIDSETRAAARLATRSLRGALSDRVNVLLHDITRLRMYVEAAIDFPDEEIDFLSDGKVLVDLRALIVATDALLASAHTGQVIRDGMRLVLAGRPNAGKSSLLNALSGRDTAIVTEVPGTTRDVLREQVQVDGMPLHIIDTAGLRDAADVVEREGIRRTRAELETADHVLWIHDGTETEAPDFAAADLPAGVPLTLVENKIDVGGQAAGIWVEAGLTRIALSAKTGEGMDLLRRHLKDGMAFGGSQEGDFIARRRHMDALQRMRSHLLAGDTATADGQSGELLAEDLRQAQLALSEITGAFTSDDLLGRIFAGFCIGK